MRVKNLLKLFAEVKALMDKARLAYATMMSLINRPIGDLGIVLTKATVDQFYKPNEEMKLFCKITDWDKWELDDKGNLIAKGMEGTGKDEIISIDRIIWVFGLDFIIEQREDILVPEALEDDAEFAKFCNTCRDVYFTLSAVASEIAELLKDFYNYFQPLLKIFDINLGTCSKAKGAERLYTGSGFEIVVNLQAKGQTGTTKINEFFNLADEPNLTIRGPVELMQENARPLSALLLDEKILAYALENTEEIKRMKEQLSDAGSIIKDLLA